MHHEIVNQIPEVLSAYLHQKFELDTIVSNTQTWIEEESQQFKRIQEQTKKFNELLTSRGADKVPSN